MNNKMITKIKYTGCSNTALYLKKLKEVTEYWTRYYETHDDSYPKKRKPDSKSFAKWCLDNGNMELLIDWEKYNDFAPSEIGAGSANKINIYCKAGHVYSGIANDIFHDSRCPYCSGHLVLKGFNDLASLRPDLASEWDYEKNTLKPDEVTTGTHKKIWWKCLRGHHYQSPVYFRVAEDRSCPICNKESIKIQRCTENDELNQRVFDPRLSYEERVRLTKEYWEAYFSTHEDSYPRQRYNSKSLAKWCVDSGNTALLVDWDRNNDLDPSKIGRASRGKITILCHNGHLYNTIANYIADGCRCPYC